MKKAKNLVSENLASKTVTKKSRNGKITFLL